MGIEIDFSELFEKRDIKTIDERVLAVNNVQCLGKWKPPQWPEGEKMRASSES